MYFSYILFLTLKVYLVTMWLRWINKCKKKRCISADKHNFQSDFFKSFVRCSQRAHTMWYIVQAFASMNKNDVNSLATRHLIEVMLSILYRYEKNRCDRNKRKRVKQKIRTALKKKKFIQQKQKRDLESSKVKCKNDSLS